MGNDRAAWVDEAYGMTKRRGRGDVIAKVVPIIGAIGQIERLRKKLQIHPFAESDILCVYRMGYG